MNFIIDANIIISAIISSKGKTRDILFNSTIELYAPDYLKREFEEHKEEILEKSKLPKADVEMALNSIYSRIIFVSLAEFREFIEEAKKASPDPDDIEYVALALKFGSSIWSNDKQLKKQKVVKVYSTQELIKQIY